MTGQGPQKVDHGGNFFMVPRRVTASVAWRHASTRARSVVIAFLHAFDGRNNGEIAFGIHEIGAALGNQNHSSNAKAVAEAIQLGFLECTSDANHAASKVRRYRITFISTGKAKAVVPATHEYDAWRPLKKRKFGGARTTMQNHGLGAETATEMKVSVVKTATHLTESRGFAASARGAETAPILDNHISRRFSSCASPLSLVRTSAPDRRAELDVLRTWTCEVVAALGYGGARKLATQAKVPEPALSRFRAGKGLPDRYRAPLQEACARHIPFDRTAA